MINILADGDLTGAIVMLVVAGASVLGHLLQKKKEGEKKSTPPDPRQKRREAERAAPTRTHPPQRPRPPQPTEARSEPSVPRREQRPTVGPGRRPERPVKLEPVGRRRPVRQSYEHGSSPTTYGPRPPVRVRPAARAPEPVPRADVARRRDIYESEIGSGETEIAGVERPVPARGVVRTREPSAGRAEPALSERVRAMLAARGDLKAAIVLSEILDPPLALRDRQRY